MSTRRTPPPSTPRTASPPGLPGELSWTGPDNARALGRRRGNDGIDNALLGELLRDRDGQRVLLVGHAATRFALDHLLIGRPLETAVVAPFARREGWTFDLTTAAPQIAVLGGAAAAHVVDELTDVYRSAFTAPGYDESEAASGASARGGCWLTSTVTDSVARRCASTRSSSGSAMATPVSAATGGATS